MQKPFNARPRASASAIWTASTLFPVPDAPNKSASSPERQNSSKSGSGGIKRSAGRKHSFAFLKGSGVTVFRSNFVFGGVILFVLLRLEVFYRGRCLFLSQSCLSLVSRAYETCKLLMLFVLRCLSG